jgi:hypothetical protein
MARPVYTIDERRIKNNLFNNMQSRFGNISNNRDSTFSNFSETIGDELNILRREMSNEFASTQMSNASGVMLDNIASERYNLLRRPASYASALDEESNIYFYVETGTFGDINEGQNINIPAGTLISVKENGFGENLSYEILYDYVLDSENSEYYCSARSLDTGYSQNVDKQSLRFHNFREYSRYEQNLLKVNNRFAILNGSDKESDQLFKSRVNNFLTASLNLNQDLLTLQSVMVPGVTEVRLIENYFGIGSLGLVVFGSGRESSRALIELVENRVLEIASPGTSISVVGGVTVYIDFDIRVYIKAKLNILEKDEIVNRIKTYVYSLVESAEITGNINLNRISNMIRSSISSDDILGIGSSTGRSVFEKVYQRKSDRFNSLPEYKEEIVSNDITLEEDERIAFGIVNVILEEGDI